ncbi:hypothetical protein MMC28_005077 [Mycoblastus sanguinarius]|nr:hypothetical protein [Mycoblastus sanguinarius]
MSAIDLRVYSNIVGVIMPRNDIRQLVASVRDILEDEVKAVEASDGEEESEAGTQSPGTGSLNLADIQKQIFDRFRRT